MPGGRPRKPDHLKVVAGTDQPTRMNPAAPKPSRALPTPPEHLSERAAECFLRVLAILEGMGLASADHVDMLAMIALTWEDVIECQQVIEDLGRVYFVPIFGLFDKEGEPVLAPKARPEVAMRNDALRRLKALLVEFGLSPASLGKVSVGGADADDPFGEFA